MSNTDTFIDENELNNQEEQGDFLEQDSEVLKQTDDNNDNA